MDENRLRRVLWQNLATDRLLGAAAVGLSPATRPPAQPSAQSPSPPAATASAAAAPATPDQATHPELTASNVEPPATTSTDQRAARVEPPPQTASLSREQKIEQLRIMDETEVRGCTNCPLCEGRINTVFGEGDADAAIMFIGEGPGQTEDELGRPFVGRAGDLLDKMIGAMGYAREQVFIANIVKCRPPNNRAPTPQEAQTCGGNYLRRQIEIIRPQVIVTLGGPAAKFVLDTSMGITRIRGVWQQYTAVQPAIPVMPTFHPAYLLRAYTSENRGKVWSDLQQVMQHVSEGGSSG